MLNSLSYPSVRRPSTLFFQRSMAVVLLGFLALTTGCISLEILVKVNRDGSGTLVQRTSVHPAFVKQATSLLGKALGEGGEEFDLFSQESLEKMAEQLGEGVRLVSREELSREDAKGVLAVYAFDDIRKLEPGKAALGDDDGDTLRFEFEQVSRRVSRLTAFFGGMEKEVEGESPELDLEPLDKETLTAQMALLKPFLKGLKLNISLEVEGKILKTNSPDVAGDRITLFEVDADRLLDDPKAVQRLFQNPPTSIAEARTALAGLPGVTVPPEPAVEVTFKGKKKP